jgi:4-diphosphocytidyl-2-C-methyl-D-erythritol kinase
LGRFREAPDRELRAMTLHARPMAKVNLTLAVGPRGPDDYHSLRSVMLRIGLADELTVEQSDSRRGDRLTVSGLPDCPVQGNLVLRAFAAARMAVGHGLPPLAAHLAKRIPLGAGLGGGSSDAAAALDLALAAWGVGLPPARMAQLALELGSDVPFFVSGAAVALVEGRGELVTPLPAVAGGAGVLLATSLQPLSTAAAYARFDEMGDAGGAAAATEELASALRNGLDGTGLAALAGRLRDANDLWPASAGLAPELGSRRDELERVSGRPWLLSGSGRSLFSIHPTAAAAEEAGRRLAADRSVGLSDVVLYATDLDGSTATWRQP